MTEPRKQAPDISLTHQRTARAKLSDIIKACPFPVLLPDRWPVAVGQPAFYLVEGDEGHQRGLAEAAPFYFATTEGADAHRRFSVSGRKAHGVRNASVPDDAAQLADAVWPTYVWMDRLGHWHAWVEAPATMLTLALKGSDRETMARAVTTLRVLEP